MELKEYFEHILDIFANIKFQIIMVRHIVEQTIRSILLFNVS